MAPHNIIIACDLPLVSTAVFKELVSRICDNKIVVAVTLNGLQPLCAVYPKSCADVFEACIREGIYKMKDVLKRIPYIEADMSRFEKQIPGTFYNINTPDDFELINGNN
jgi:molybdopterin-guanine dinucleotide biosynthesis protein A